MKKFHNTSLSVAHLPIYIFLTSLPCYFLEKSQNFLVQASAWKGIYISLFIYRCLPVHGAFWGGKLDLRLPACHSPSSHISNFIGTTDLQVDRIFHPLHQLLFTSSPWSWAVLRHCYLVHLLSGNHTSFKELLCHPCFLWELKKETSPFLRTRHCKTDLTHSNLGLSLSVFTSQIPSLELIFFNNISFSLPTLSGATLPSKTRGSLMAHFPTVSRTFWVLCLLSWWISGLSGLGKLYIYLSIPLLSCSLLQGHQLTYTSVSPIFHFSAWTCPTGV